MTARALLPLFDTVYLLVLGAWAGASVLVLLLLPRVSKAGPDPRWEQSLLDPFYRLGASCGALALPAALCARLAYPEFRTPWFALQALCLIVLTFAMLAGASRVSPEDRRGSAPSLRFRLALLLVLLAALAAFHATRPPPRSLGIIEPPPGARPAPSPPSLTTSAGETPESGIH